VSERSERNNPVHCSPSGERLSGATWTAPRASRREVKEVRQ
jgi:hypothetical protein